MGLLHAPLEARRGIYTGHRVCIPVCVHEGVCICAHRRVHTGACVCIHAQVCICAHKHVHRGTCVCICAHGCVYLCSQACTHRCKCVCIIDMFEGFGTGRPCSVEAQIYSPDISVPNWLTCCCNSKETPSQVMHSQIWGPESKIRVCQGHVPSAYSRRRSLLPLPVPRGSRHLGLWLPPSHL